jgi:hypothetical protein
MNRINQLNEYLKYWQRILNLQKWDLKIKITAFNRTDYNQSGDIEVDLKNKKATILITKEDTRKDSAVILHELIHLLLWAFDQFCEKEIPKNKKNQYFDLLEKTAADLTNIFLQKDK